MDEVVRKPWRSRPVPNGDELHAPHGEEATLADTRLANGLELDLGGLGQRRTQGGHGSRILEATDGGRE